MQEDVRLSDREIAEAVAADRLKTPDETGIFTGARFLLWTPVGGEMQLVTVMCKGDVYTHTDERGRKWRVVDVFGYGVRKRVPIIKLKERENE